MKKYTFGDPAASNILVQMVDDHDLSVIESEVSLIREFAGPDFFLIALKVDDWNRDLSPWKAPAVFGDEDFGGKAQETLKAVLEELEPADREKQYFIGGYSLAGLFALWSACYTDIFTGVAAASPSVWFPGFTDHMRENNLHAAAVYLSLGDREERTRNPVMSEVGNRIRDTYDLLKDSGVNCVLEWNKGNHFKEPDRRTAKAFAWVLQNGAVPDDRRCMLDRVVFYEQIYDELTAAVQTKAVLSNELRDKAARLEQYYTSGEWLEDYEADEAGLFPADLKRGVLSQDGVDELLNQLKEHTGVFS